MSNTGTTKSTTSGQRSSANRSGGTSVSDQLSNEADELVGQGKDAASGLSSIAQGATGELKRSAALLARDGSEKLADALSKQLSTGAGFVEEASESLRAAAAELDDTLPPVAYALRTAANRGDDLAEQIRTRTLGELLEEGSAYARPRQPHPGGGAVCRDRNHRAVRGALAARRYCTSHRELRPRAALVLHACRAGVARNCRDHLLHRARQGERRQSHSKANPGSAQRNRTHAQGANPITEYQTQQRSYEPDRTPQRSYMPSLSERLAGAARAQPAGLLLLVAGTSLLLSGMRPPSREATRRARTAVRRIAQGDFSPVTESASDLASGVREQVSGLGDKASELARSYTDSVSGLADDAQRTVRETSQQLAETARSSVQSGASFVLEDQPLLLAAIGLAAGATLGAILPNTSQENRLMGETRDKVVELASDAAKQKLGEFGDAAGEAAERLKSAVKERAGLATEDLGDVAKEVVEPFANVASGSGTSSGGGSGSRSSQASGQSSGGGGTSSGNRGSGSSSASGSVGKIS